MNGIKPEDLEKRNLKIEIDQQKKYFLFLIGIPGKNFYLVMLCKFEIPLGPLWRSQTWNCAKRWDWILWKLIFENNLCKFGTPKDLMHAVKSWGCNWFFFAGGDFPMASWWKEWNLYIRENAWFNGWIIFERINFGLCGMWNLWTKEQYKGFFKQYQVRPLQLTALQPVRFFNLESNLYIRRKVWILKKEAKKRIA